MTNQADITTRTISEQRQDAKFLVAAGISAERRWHMADLYDIVLCQDMDTSVPVGRGPRTEKIHLEVFRGRDGREIAMGYGPITGTLAVGLATEIERPCEQETTRQPTSPGAILRRELKVRGWTQKYLAWLMGRRTATISLIVTGKKRITPQTAIQLGLALGTSPELWWNLETNYRLQKAKEK